MGCIALIRCVLVLRCGLAVVVWYPYVGLSRGGVVSVCRLKQGWCGIRMQAEAGVVWYPYVG